MNTHIPQGAFLDPSTQPLAAYHRRHNSLANVVVGGAFLATAGAAALGIWQGADSEAHITADVPFVEQAQEAINNMEGVLAGIGAVGFVGALGTVGGLKIASRWNSVARSVDFASSKEMTNDGKHNPGIVVRALRRGFAGNVPVLAGVGVALGTFTAGISSAVTEGPSEPVRVLDGLAPGESMVVQYERAMPMVQSNVNAELGQAVQQEAANRGVNSTSFDLNLGVITGPDGHSSDDLTLGMNIPPGSPLDWKPADGCRLIPVAVDKSAHLTKGTRVDINGTPAEVVDTMDDTSAINRTGVMMDKEAMQACLEQTKEGNDHAIVLDTNPATAKEILEVANKDLQSPAAIITKRDYENNSEDFWAANVKPLTGVLSLAAIGSVLFSLGGNLRARMLRNRTELAIDFARRISENKMRAIELVRSAKNGLLASGLGVVMGVPATLGANFVVSGLRAGVGIKEIAVGVGVGMIGSIGAALGKLLRPRKLINVREHTR